MHHKYFCDNMKLRKFEQMFEKRDREVHRMETVKNKIIGLLDKLKPSELDLVLKIILRLLD